MDKFQRQLKTKQIIRKKFDDNHQQRIYQLENILVKQGIPRTDVNVWSRYRQGQAKLDYLHTQKTTLYDDTCEIACKKLDYIESDFYQIIANPKQTERIIQQSFNEDKKIKPYSDTFIATISAMAVFLLSFYCYPLPIIFLREFADVYLTNFQLAFSVAVFTPLISSMVYIGKKGKLSYLLLPVLIWLWYLTPYLLDLNAELISVETSDFQPATCYSKTRFTSRTFPCIYLDELDAPIKISKNVKIDDIEVVRLKYHPHTQEWQELQLEMLEGK